MPVIGVQHHHAHAAAIAGRTRHRGPVIGLALDGVGLGTDGGPGAARLLWVDGGRDDARSAGSAATCALPLPGGDVAAREPWRMAAAVLHARWAAAPRSSCALRPWSSAARGLQAMLDAA